MILIEQHWCFTFPIQFMLIILQKCSKWFSKCHSDTAWLSDGFWYIRKHWGRMEHCRDFILCQRRVSVMTKKISSKVLAIFKAKVVSRPSLSHEKEENLHTNDIFHNWITRALTYQFHFRFRQSHFIYDIYNWWKFEPNPSMIKGSSRTKLHFSGRHEKISATIFHFFFYKSLKLTKLDSFAFFNII